MGRKDLHRGFVFGVGERRGKGIKAVVFAAILAMSAGMGSVRVYAADVSGGNGGRPQEESPGPVISIPQPLVQISSKGAEGDLAAGQEFLTEITIKNKGVVAIERPVVTLAPSGNVTAVGSTNSSYEVKDIKPGESQTVTLRWKMSDHPSAGSNEIGVGMKFYYNNGSGLSQGTDEGKILLTSSEGKQTMEGAAPTAIIKSFDYGQASVAAGEEFDLNVTVMNTSGVKKIENLVITAEVGEGLGLIGSTNVFYLNGLGTGKEQNFSLPLQVSPTAKNIAGNVTFQFKYEYTDNEKRSQASGSQMAAVPIYQKDRFTVLETVLPENPVMGEEQNISVKYVNEGRGDVSNVKAALKGGDQESAHVQYLGNFEPGKTGSINFLVTPDKTGSNEYKAVITYEDANMKEQIKEIPITFEAGEAAPVDGEMDGENMMALPQEGGGMPKAAAGIGAAGVAAGAVLILRRRKKKECVKRYDSLDFDDETPEE